MARVFITGSTDGLGLLAAQMLIAQGHEVVLHAKNEQRAKEARVKIPQAMKIVIADLGEIQAILGLAREVNALGVFDAIIHNAGVYEGSKEQIFLVNTIAPYILTCRIKPPKRLIYISSGMHRQGTISLSHLSLASGCSYSDSKLYLLMLAKAVARINPKLYANAVDPGWVPTKMGGAAAPDDLLEGAKTQVWLSISEEEAAKVSGAYFFHHKEVPYLAKADDEALQDELIKLCETLTGVALF